MNLIFADAETFYSSKEKYSLRNMTTQEYIRDSRFKCLGWGFAINKGAPVWVTGEARMRQWLERLIPGNVIVGHNISGFDAPIISWMYGLKPKLIIDTLALSRALIGERLRSHSLESVSQFLFGVGKLGFLKEMDGVYDPTDYQLQQLGTYCALHPQSDINLTRNIFYKLFPHFPKRELFAADLVAQCYTSPSLLLDPTLLKQYHSEVVAKRLRALDDAGVENATDVRSNDKFAAGLQRLGVDPPRKLSPTTGKETWAFAKTDEGMLALQEHDDVRVQALVAARLENRSTLAESRAENFINMAKYGPMPVAYSFSGAQTTHRLSGTSGTNLQNLPRGGALRRAIMAPIRHTLVVADLSQIELRITLQLAVQLLKQLGLQWEYSAEYQALELLASGGDLYSHFGSIIYQTKVTKETHPTERQIAKSAVLGLGFGMGKAKFVAYCKAQNVSMTEEEANRIVKLYRGTYTGVVRLWRYMQDSFKSYVDYPKNYQVFKEPDVWISAEPLFGDCAIGLEGALQVKYPGLKYNAEDKNYEYTRANGTTKMFAGKFVENLVQYLARLVIMEQTIAVAKHYKIAMQTHDEITAVVPKEEGAWDCDKSQNVAEAKAWIQNIMTAPLKWWPSLPLGVEIKSNDRYGLAK